MMPHRTSIAGLALAALAGVALAGCGLGRVNQDDVSYSYSLVEFSAAAGGRDLRTVIIGNPFGGSDADFDRAVTGVMNSYSYGVVTNFTTTPNETARPEYKTVLVFNPDPEVGSAVVCGDHPFPTNPAERPIVVRAAFCIQGNGATAASGFLADGTGPTDPRFTSMIADLTRALFPGYYEY